MSRAEAAYRVRAAPRHHEQGRKRCGGGEAGGGRSGGGGSSIYPSPDEPASPEPCSPDPGSPDPASPKPASPEPARSTGRAGRSSRKATEARLLLGRGPPCWLAAPRGCTGARRPLPQQQPAGAAPPQRRTHHQLSRREGGPGVAASSTMARTKSLAPVRSSFSPCAISVVGRVCPKVSPPSALQVLEAHRVAPPADRGDKPAWRRATPSPHAWGRAPSRPRARSRYTCCPGCRCVGLSVLPLAGRIAYGFKVTLSITEWSFCIKAIKCSNESPIA